MLNYTNGTISKVQIVGNYRANDLYLPQIARERKVQRKLMDPKKSKTSSMPLPLTNTQKETAGRAALFRDDSRGWNLSGWWRRSPPESQERLLLGTCIWELAWGGGLGSLQQGATHLPPLGHCGDLFTGLLASGLDLLLEILLKPEIISTSAPCSLHWLPISEKAEAFLRRDLCGLQRPCASLLLLPRPRPLLHPPSLIPATGASSPARCRPRHLLFCLPGRVFPRDALSHSSRPSPESPSPWSLPFLFSLKCQPHLPYFRTFHISLSCFIFPLVSISK